MAVNASRLRLAAENGRRVGRTPKAMRLAAQPATDAARLARALAEVYAEGCHVLVQAQRAEETGKLALAAACGQEPITTAALARESGIAMGYVTSRMSNLLWMLERAREGTLCA